RAFRLWRARCLSQREAREYRTRSFRPRSLAANSSVPAVATLRFRPLVKENPLLRASAGNWPGVLRQTFQRAIAAAAEYLCARRRPERGQFARARIRAAARPEPGRLRARRQSEKPDYP